MSAYITELANQLKFRHIFSETHFLSKFTFMVKYLGGRDRLQKIFFDAYLNLRKKIFICMSIRDKSHIRNAAACRWIHIENHFDFSVVKIPKKN